MIKEMIIGNVLQSTTFPIPFPASICLMTRAGVTKIPHVSLPTYIMMYPRS